MTTSLREALEEIQTLAVASAVTDDCKRLGNILTRIDKITRAALSSPAPDRLGEASAIKRDLEGAKVGLDALLAAVHAGDPKRELLVRIGDLMRDVKVASERADRLSRQPEAEPVAWIEFADNGNIRFWTSNPARAWTEGDNGRPLRKFTLAELVALAASPRLDRERDRVFGQVLDALKLIRMYVKEGGVPRYTVTPGAGLNSAIEESIDPAIEAADSIMMASITTIYCDVCKGKGARQNQCVPVVFTTEQTDGRPAEPYLTMETMDICSACIGKIIAKYPLRGSGAQGHNRYEFTDEAHHD